MRRRAAGRRAWRAVAVALIGGCLAGCTTSGSDRGPANGSVGDFATYGAFAAGSTLYIGERRVDLDGQVQEIDYTRSGAIVSTESGGGPPDYLFVTGDGEVTLVAGGTTGPSVGGVGTDPAQDRLVWAVGSGRRSLDLVVADARTGAVEKRIEVRDDVPVRRSAYLAPRPFLTGDTAFVRMLDATYEVDLKTGSTRRHRADMIDVAGNAYVTRSGRKVTVRSLTDDRIMATEKQWGRDDDVSLSPDGRYLLVAGWGDDSYGGRITDVGSGEREPFDLMGNGIDVCATGCGWTASARVLGVSIHEPEHSTTCDPRNLRDCRVVGLDDIPNDADKRLGGIDDR